MPKGRDGGGEWRGREAARVETRAAEDRAVEVFARLSHRQLVETNPSTEVALEFVRGRCEVRWARLTAGEKAYFHGLVEDQQQDEQEERMAGLERQEVKSHEKGKKGRGKSFLDQDTSSGDEEEQVTKEQGCQRRISFYPLFRKNVAKMPGFTDFWTESKAPPFASKNTEF